jgi:hypothetical protein
MTGAVAIWKHGVPGRDTWPIATMPARPAKRPRAREKDLDKLVKKAWDAGWCCIERKSNYILCYPPDGDQGPVVVKCTPSGSRYLKKVRAAFARAGLAL